MLRRITFLLAAVAPHAVEARGLVPRYNDSTGDGVVMVVFWLGMVALGMHASDRYLARTRRRKLRSFGVYVQALLLAGATGLAVIVVLAQLEPVLGRLIVLRMLLAAAACYGVFWLAIARWLD